MDKKGLDNLIKDIAVVQTPDPTWDGRLDNMRGIMELSRANPGYKPGPNVSRNVEDRTGQPKPTPLEMLRMQLSAAQDPYMYDNAYRPDGLPLSGDQVQAFAERQPGYVDPEAARIEALIQALYGRK